MEMHMEFEYTPPRSPVDEKDFDDMTDEELDLYFANYVPLSNLPTPPPAKELLPTPAQEEEEPASMDQTRRHHNSSPELEGLRRAQALHLSNLVPTNVSSRRPDTALIIEFLERANLPAEIVAFAACVLDRLSQSFAQSWRAATSSPLTQSSLPSNSLLRGCKPCLPCEVIVLAALAIAHGYLSDGERESRHWAEREGGGIFSVREIEQTKWCLLQDIAYGLMRIEDYRVKKMMEDIQRLSVGGRQSQNRILSSSPTKSVREKEVPLKLNLESYQGAAIWMNGVHTPEPSP